MGDTGILPQLEAIHAQQLEPHANLEAQVLAIIGQYLTGTGARLCLSCRRRLARATGLPEPVKRAGRGRPPLSTDPASITALRASGGSLRGIAATLGVSKSTIARRLAAACRPQ